MIDLPRETNRLLEKWNGGDAKLWSYRVSFQELVIRIEKSEVRGNLHVVCKPCLSLVLPRVFWKDCLIKIAVVSCDELLGATFRVEDPSVGVVIECMGVHFHEDVDPVF